MQGRLITWWSAALAACLFAALGVTSSAHAALSSFGSNGLTYNVGATALDKNTVGYARLARAGMNTVRVEMPWQLIQPTSASGWDWATPDAAMAGLPSGVQVIALVNDSPTWARDSASRSFCGSASPSTCRTPPADNQLKSWQRFVKAVLDRYGSRIVAVEAWNEPNLVDFWRPKVDPARWARLVHATAGTVHSARPGLPVISGGLVGGIENDPAHSIGPIPFLQAAYSAVPGLAADIDQYGLHPYSRDACGNHGADSWAVQLDFTSDACATAGWDVERMRYVIAKYDPSAKIAVTEFGFHTDGAYAIDEATQASWLVRAYDWFNSQADITTLVLHTLFDTTWEPSLSGATYGLVHADNTPKAAWTAFHDKLAPGS